MIIGLTGGIGSGKSTIARELAKRGFTVYDCDSEAKRIIAEDKAVQADIIALLGPDSFVFSPSSLGPSYNTSYVAQRVFAEPELLEQLNAIVHPVVKKDILSTLSSQLSAFFIESAILYEAGLDKLCSKVIVVDAPEELRIARTIARDYNGQATPDNIEKIRVRIHAQQTPSGDLRIINDGLTPIPELADTILQYLNI